MRKIRSAFTFVELIVVLTIIAILATIGFTVYESYLSSGRDTNRIVQLKDIHGGLTVYSTKARLPLPESSVSITSSGNLISYQGNLSDTIMKSIKYNGGSKDSELDIFPTYILSGNKKEFQLLSFVEDAETLQLYTPTQSHAEVNYTILFPKIIGAPLGAILDANSQTPIQESSVLTTSGEYDILTGTGDLRVYYSDNDFFDTNWGDIRDIIPNRHCKRILDIGNSRGNGDYTIKPDGINEIRAYCDMEIDGGGWTLIARSVVGTTTGDFGWIYERGSISDNSEPYSFGSGSRFLDFDEIMNAQYSDGKRITMAAGYLVDGNFYYENFDQHGTLPTSSDHAANIIECRNILNLTSPNHCDASYAYRKTHWGKFAYDSGYIFTNSAGSTYSLERDQGNFRADDVYDNLPAMIFVR